MKFSLISPITILLIILCFNEIVCQHSNSQSSNISHENNSNQNKMSNNNKNNSNGNNSSELKQKIHQNIYRYHQNELSESYHGQVEDRQPQKEGKYSDVYDNNNINNNSWAYDENHLNSHDEDEGCYYIHDGNHENDYGNDYYDSVDENEEQHNDNDSDPFNEDYYSINQPITDGNNLNDYQTYQNYMPNNQNNNLSNQINYQNQNLNLNYQNNQNPNNPQEINSNINNNHNNNNNINNNNQGQSNNSEGQNNNSQYQSNNNQGQSNSSQGQSNSSQGQSNNNEQNNINQNQNNNINKQNNNSSSQESGNLPISIDFEFTLVEDEVLKGTVQKILNQSIEEINKMIYVNPNFSRKPSQTMRISNNEGCPNSNSNSYLLIGVQILNNTPSIPIQNNNSGQQYVKLLADAQQCQFRNDIQNSPQKGRVRVFKESFEKQSEEIQRITLEHELLHILGFNEFYTKNLTLTQQNNVYYYKSDNIMRYINSNPSVQSCLGQGVPVQIVHSQFAQQTQQTNGFDHFSQIIQGSDDLMTPGISTPISNQSFTKLTAEFLRDLNLYAEIRSEHLPDFSCPSNQTQNVEIVDD